MNLGELYDLKISGDDLAVSPDDEPAFLAGVNVVAQDVRHRLRASGQPPRLLGSAEADRTRLLAAMAREVEEDGRIRPGTARAEETGPGQMRITAKTLDQATINTGVNG